MRTQYYFVRKDGQVFVCSAYDQETAAAWLETWTLHRADTLAVFSGNVSHVSSNYGVRLCGEVPAIFVKR